MSNCSQFIAHPWNPYLCSECMEERKGHRLSGTDLPRIIILATGGTIAGESDDGGHPGAYRAGVRSIDVLLTAVPILSEIAHIQTQQVANIDSKDMTIELWKTLAILVNQLLASNDVDGIVITHGTDTLEETAFFLYMTAKTEKPVVLTAAMRPATALSADGPLNLLNAVVVAASKASFGQGVLVVMNGQIYTARDVTKTNTYSVDTFRSNEFGALGWVQGHEALFQRSITPMHMNTAKSQFKINQSSELPSVQIVISYTSPSPAVLNALVANGVEGIIIAGTGNGTIHTSLELGGIDAVNRGVAVVRSSRVCYGHMTHDASDDVTGFLNSGTLNPWKARVLLMLILAEGITDRAARQRIFDSY